MTEINLSVQANVILQHNEYSMDVGEGQSRVPATTEMFPPPLYSISYVDSNQLAANVPIEDKMTSARCLHTTGVYLYVGIGVCVCKGVSVIHS